MNQIHTASNDDLLEGLAMAQQLYEVGRKKYDDDEAEYWSDIHNDIYEELQRRGIDPYLTRDVAAGEGKKYPW